MFFSRLEFSGLKLSRNFEPSSKFRSPFFPEEIFGKTAGEPFLSAMFRGFCVVSDAELEAAPWLDSESEESSKINGR